jgi:excisionase family DNA binding protein
MHWDVDASERVFPHSGVTVSEKVVRLPKWLTEQDVAARLGVHKSTVQRLRKRGEFKAKLIGGRWKVREDWLYEYEDEDTPCRSSSGSANGFLESDQTARTGASAGSIQKLDRRDVHRSAQTIFKRQKCGSLST